MTTLHLRDYQREAIDAVFKAWSDGMQRPAIVLPTGAGKTVVFASLIKEWVDSPRVAVSGKTWGFRVIVLAHRDELVDQAIAKIRAIAPDLNVGKVKAGDNDVDADVIVASVATLGTVHGLLRRRAIEEHGPIGLIITDECHHAAAASYRKIYDAFPDALQLGVTATMARGDGVGLGGVWEDVVYKRSILNLISKKHLVDVRTKRVDLEALDMGAVKASRGDWQAGDLGQALMDAEADTAIARAYREHAGDRQGIVFTPTVETAAAAASALRFAGISSGFISGETPRDERQVMYESFRGGRTQVLVNCMVLTEGFDAPWAEVAVIARPTKSATLYTQMVGRVLRPWPGKTEALVLDLVGASSNGLRTLIDLEPGVVKALEDGESLAEAVVREAEEGDRRLPAGSIAFEMKVRDVDSFAGSAMAWTRTPKGVMNIAIGDGTYVLLWPTEPPSELWDVVLAQEGQKWVRTPHRGLSVGEAMAWGEAVAEDHAAFNVARSARWRKDKPSQAQLNLASSLGILSAERLTRGALSDEMNRVKGGRYIDRYVKG